MSKFTCFLLEDLGRSLCDKIPTVTYNDSWLGIDYIDRLNPNDKVFEEGPVVKFIDDMERSAIAIKYTTKCDSSDTNSGPFSFVAFQRYAGSAAIAVGGHYSDNAMFYAAAKLKTNGDWFEKLLDTGTASYRTAFEGNCIIDLYDDKENDVLLGEMPTVPNEEF
ncbi:MAG: hypothetical protein K0T99_03985 [Alphaproteobacteria bacterium]|nr:hypothetical protein [Alphaproteobacteria bacterium]